MAVLLDAFQEAVGSIKVWLRPNTSEPLPPNWVICDGSTIVDPDSPFNTKAIPDLRDKFVRGHPTLTNANFAADATYQAGGTIPSGGASSQDLAHTHGAGAHTHNIGAHSHAIPADAGHSHSTPNHSHTIPDHQHTIANDGGHSHTGSTGPGIDKVSSIGGVKFTYAGVNGEHDHSITTNFQPAHNHGGNTGGASVSGWSTNSGGGSTTSVNGAHSHGGTTASASGTTDPGSGNTDSALSTISTIPPYTGLVYLLKIK